MSKSKYIDAEAYKTAHKNAYESALIEYGKRANTELAIKVYEAVVRSIDAFPAADVAEVMRCKDCKHFEYDHPYIIQGMPVLGHEVCNAWGGGCKTDENGYCFMAERRTDG